MLGHMVALFFVFLRDLHILLHVAAPVHAPTSRAGGLPFSTSSPALVSCGPFDDGRSGQREAVPPAALARASLLVHLAAPRLCCGTQTLQFWNTGSVQAQ